MIIRCSVLSFIILLMASGVSHAHSFGKNDTIPATIHLPPEKASEFIDSLLHQQGLWSEQGKALRLSLQRLLNHYKEPFDSVRVRLQQLEFQQEDYNLTQLVVHDTIPLFWLNDSTFIIHSRSLTRSPFNIQETLVPHKNQQLSEYDDPTPEALELVFDTLRVTIIDTMYLDDQNVRMYRYINGEITPPIKKDESMAFRILEDSSAVVRSVSSYALLGSEDAPFYKLRSKQMTDSLDFAIRTLMDYTLTRDSMLVYINNLDGRRTPLWLTVKEDEMRRFWVKNHSNDSITLWIANTAKNTLTLILEENVNVERRTKRSAANIPLSTFQPSSSLARIKPLSEIPVFWVYGLASSLTVNQTYFSNWARGGESSLATTLDIRAMANHNNKTRNARWINEARLRYGSISIDEYKSFRTNTDVLEFNSKYNSKLREKLDLSSSFYFKTQVAKGYKNLRDTEVVSRFLNPGTFTLGVGVEYQPFKDFRLNFSPLSYRNTFVLDTVRIKQTLHGIDPGQKSRQEMGGQLVIQSKAQIIESLVVTNNIRLFSGYLDKPKNVDVDWEINIEKQFNWYFMVRLNFHIIYDDDILFPVEDELGNPRLLPDGSPWRVPKMQLKQILGLTLAFKI
jgi:hypothetical protein